MPSKSRVAEILLKAKVIDELQLRSARARHEQWGGRLSKIVAEMGLADEDTIVDAIARASGLQRTQIGHIQKDAAALARIDVKFAEEYGVFPIALKDNGKTLVVAFADPTDLDILDMVSSKARARLSPMVAGETEIAHAILRYYRNQDPAAAGPNRARQMVQKAEEPEEQSEDGDEFKITDMSGKTMVKHIGDIQPPGFTEPAMDALKPAPPVGDLLDDMLGAGPPAPPVAALTAEEQQRLESLKVNQAKSAAIVRAVAELLIDKGYATQKDVATRFKL